MTAGIPENSGYTNIPHGKLGIIAMKGTEEFVAEIDQYISKWREENIASLNLEGYKVERCTISALSFNTVDRLAGCCVLCLSIERTVAIKLVPISQ